MVIDPVLEQKPQTKPSNEGKRRNSGGLFYKSDVDQVLSERNEREKPADRLARLVSNVHDFGFRNFKEKDKYEVDLGDGYTETLYYHNYKEEDGTDGHVANIERMALLYTDMVAETGNDILGLHKKARNYLRKEFSHYANEFDDKQLDRLANIALIWSARLHDLNNGVEKVNWRKLNKEGEPTLDNTELLSSMKEEGSEDGSVEMFTDFIEENCGSLELDDKEKVVVDILGRGYIKRTEFNWAFCDQDESNTALIELAVLDQVGSMFNPNGLKQVIGLLNEKKVIFEKIEDVNDPNLDNHELFRPDVFMGGFITKRFEMYQKVGGVDFDTFCMTVDKYREVVGDTKMSEMLGVDVDDMSKVGKMNEFVKQRLDFQSRVGRSLWSKEFVPHIFAFEPDKVESAEEHKKAMIEASEFYKNNFWTMTPEDVNSFFENIN